MVSSNFFVWNGTNIFYGETEASSIVNVEFLLFLLPDSHVNGTDVIVLVDCVYQRKKEKLAKYIVKYMYLW